MRRQTKKIAVGSLTTQSEKKKKKKKKNETIAKEERTFCGKHYQQNITVWV